MDHDPARVEPRQQRWRRMAVVVAVAHRDHRHERVHGGQEVVGGRGRTVVRHLEQPRPDVGTPVEQPSLPGDLHVPGQQRHATGLLDPQHHGPIVGPALGVVEVGAVRRRQHVDTCRAQGCRQVLVHPDRGRGVGGQGSAAPTRRHPVRDLLPVHGSGHPQRRDVHCGDQVGQPAHVVGVVMGHDDQVEVVDATATQPGRRAVVGAGVHEHPVSRGGGDQDGVALADVDGRDGQHP